MEKNFTENDYYLHSVNFRGALKTLEEELERIEKSGKKILWYYSGKKTLERLKKKNLLLKKGIKRELELTPHDVNNIVYVLLKKLER